MSIVDKFCTHFRLLIFSVYRQGRSRLVSPALAHRLPAQLDPVGVVYEPVQDGVSVATVLRRAQVVFVGLGSGCQSVWVRTSAFRITRSLRMQAVSASLLGLPAVVRRS